MIVCRSQERQRLMKGRRPTLSQGLCLLILTELPFRPPLDGLQRVQKPCREAHHTHFASGLTSSLAPRFLHTFATFGSHGTQGREETRPCQEGSR